MIELYVTHYVTDALPGYNDIAIDCVLNIRSATGDDEISYRIIVLYWTDSAACELDLWQRMPPDVELVRCESGVQPFLMNQATKKARGADLFLCLHNDIRPARGWLRNIVADVRAAEAIHGRGNVIASPRYIPYHWLTPHPDAYKHPEFWARVSPDVEAKVLSRDAMRAWCAQHGFTFNGTHVISPETSYTTDDGHQLMMYCAAPEFFDQIGGCDESFAGLNYGDCDWGIRALQAGKKNLVSQGCLLGHITGLTFFNPEVANKLGDNHERFIAKWGRPLWDELQTGGVWTRLHREQIR